MTSASDTVSPAGVILAGGLSRRMFADAHSGTGGGIGDKSLLQLGATTMLGHVVARFRPQVSTLAINANGDARRFDEFALPVVADTVEGFVGPLAGVLAGLRWAAHSSPNVTHVCTVSADAPFLPADLVRRLHAAAVSTPGAIALAQSRGELHPVIGCWPIALADDLEAALLAGVRKVLRWTDVHGTIPVTFECLDVGGEMVDPFFNANSPAELEEARRLLRRQTL